MEFFLLLSRARSGCIGGGTHSSYRSTARSEGFRQSSLASPLILTKISALRKKMSVNSNYPSLAARLRTLIMACHEQVAAEIDMHAEVLLALSQRLDFVLHRVRQRREA